MDSLDNEPKQEIFVLETLGMTGWHRGSLYWSENDAIDAGQKMVAMNSARRIRVLVGEIYLRPLAEIDQAGKLTVPMGPKGKVEK